MIISVVKPAIAEAVVTAPRKRTKRKMIKAAGVRSRTAFGTNFGFNFTAFFYNMTAFRLIQAVKKPLENREHHE
jgi:hypothetical protein